MLGGALWTRASATLLAREAWRRGPRGLAARLGEALRPGRAWLEATLPVRTGARAVRAVGAACRARTGERVLGRDRPRHRLRAGSGRRADRQGRGGPSAVAAFEGLIRELGGDIRTRRGRDGNCRGRRPGERRAAGERARCIEAGRGVICSVTPTQLSERLLAGDSSAAMQRERVVATATARATCRSTTR